MNRERKPFGLFDWCILTLVAALLAVGAFVFFKHAENAVPTVEIECLFRIPTSDEPLQFAVGDEVRNENGTVAFGRVANVSQRPYKTTFLRNGEAVYESVEGLTETELLVRMIAEKTEEYRVGDIRICAGASGTYRVGNALVSGVQILHLQEVENDE